MRVSPSVIFEIKYPSMHCINVRLQLLERETGKRQFGNAAYLLYLEAEFVKAIIHGVHVVQRVFLITNHTLILLCIELPLPFSLLILEERM